MSEEHVEIVRKTLHDFNEFMRGELSGESVMELVDVPFEFHWHDARTLPDLPQDLRGAPEAIEFFEQLRSAW